MHRSLVWALVVGVLVGAVACGGGESAASSEVEATAIVTPTEVAVASVVATATMVVEVADEEPLPWELPRGDESPGVLLVDWGPLRGWEPGKPGAGRGALVPLEAATAEMLPGYEPFDLGHSFREVWSRDGRWLAVSVSPTQNSSGELRVIGSPEWTALDLQSPGWSGEMPTGLDPIEWSPGRDLLYARRTSLFGQSSTIYAIDIEGRTSRVVADYEFRLWEPSRVSRDGEVIYLFGYESSDCCGVEVEGAPFVEAVRTSDGAVLGRVELPDLVIGQQFERLFDNENEYNVIRDPGVALSPDGKRLYVVQSDEDRVTVVDLERLVVERSVEVRRPRSTWSRLGSWVLGGFVERAEAKGGVYRMKEARVSSDGRLLYVTGVAEIACEEMNYFACVNGAPFGLQIIDLESMELVHEEPGIREMAMTPDGQRLVGIGSAYDQREGVSGPVGYGVKILDARNGELVAHLEPELVATQLAVSSDGRFAYVVSAGPGVSDDPSERCEEACTRIAVIGIGRGEVVAERLLDSGIVRLVSFVDVASPWN